MKFSSEELENSLKEIMETDRRACLLDDYVSLIPEILKSRFGSATISSTASKLAENVENPEGWIVIISGLICLGVETGMKIVELRRKEFFEKELSSK